MTAHKLKNEPHCPTCETKLAGASALEGDALPQPGDVTMCLYCTEVLEFTEDLQFAKIGIETLQPEVQDILATVLVQLQNSRPTFH